MISTGNDGKAKLWNSQAMEHGIHLRWFFEPSLGFPDLGFNLYRRTSVKMQEITFSDMRDNLAAKPSFKWSLDSLLEISTKDFTNLTVDSEPLGLRILPSTPIIIVFSAQKPSYVQIQAQLGGTHKVEIKGSLLGKKVFTVNVVKSTLLEIVDSIDKLQVTGDGWITLFHLDLRDPNDGWDRPFATPCLPVSDPQYLCRHRHADNTIAGDEEEVKSRLPSVPEVQDRYLKSAFQSLRPELISFAIHSPAPPWNQTALGGVDFSDPIFKGDVNHLDYVLLLSLDPYLARILGLYFIDSEVANLPNEFDYKVQGYWLRNEPSNGTMQFVELQSINGFVISPFQGFTIDSSVPLQLSNDRKRVAFEGMEIVVSIKFAFLRVKKLTLSGQLVGEFSATKILQDGSGSAVDLRQQGSPGGEEPIIITPIIDDPNLAEIKFTGVGRLELTSLDYEAERKIVSFGAIAYHTMPSAPKDLPSIPFDFSAFELKGWALAPLPDAVGLNAVGLSWARDAKLDDSDNNNNDKFLLPSASPLMTVEYHDFEMLPDLPKPQIKDLEQFEMLNDGRPIMVVTPTEVNKKASPPLPASSLLRHNLSLEEQKEIRRLGSLEFLINGSGPVDQLHPASPISSLNFIHPRLGDGWYGYRLRTIDFFGRINSYDQAGNDIKVVAVENSRRPPAPLLLDANYIQQGVSSLLRTREESDWLANHPDSDGLRVKWSWPPALYHIAPDALTFKIYGPDMEAQSETIADPQAELSGKIVNVKSDTATGNIVEVLHITGKNITNVEKVGNLVNKVITDCTISEGRKDVFAYSRLVQGTNNYKVLEHTDGINVVFWVERTDGNSPEPTIGEEFSLDRSIVKTDVLFHDGAELLVGGNLGVGGRDSTVIAYAGESEFLVQHAIQTPPLVGAFILQPFASGIGLSANITHIISEDSNTRTSVVETDRAIPAGGILAGGIVIAPAGGSGSANINSFEIVDNTAYDPASTKSQITLRWITEIGFVQKFVSPDKVVLSQPLSFGRVFEGGDLVIGASQYEILAVDANNATLTIRPPGSNSTLSPQHGPCSGPKKAQDRSVQY